MRKKKERDKEKEEKLTRADDEKEENKATAAIKLRRKAAGSRNTGDGFFQKNGANEANESKREVWGGESFL